MNETFLFRPPRRIGLAFHILMTLVLVSTSVFALLYGFSQQVGGYFVFLLIISLLMVAPLPLVLYRAYALSQATYRLERDGLRLHWGLRVEDIPLPEIEWVRRAEDLASDMRLPPLQWPGAVLGKVNTNDLGPVEFLASTTKSLLLVATTRRIYAISPDDPDAFIQAFQDAFEMGSLTPLSSISVQPAAYLSQIWSDRLASGLILAGLALMLVLFVGVSLAIPGTPTASLGFNPDGSPLPPVPSEQLLLLPILGSFFFLADLTTGLFFYRRGNSRPIAYMIWGVGAFTILLLLAAALMNL